MGKRAGKQDKKGEVVGKNNAEAGKLRNKLQNKGVLGGVGANAPGRVGANAGERGAKEVDPGAKRRSIAEADMEENIGVVAVPGGERISGAHALGLRKKPLAKARGTAVALKIAVVIAKTNLSGGRRGQPLEEVKQGRICRGRKLAGQDHRTREELGPQSADVSPVRIVDGKVKPPGENGCEPGANNLIAEAAGTLSIN